MEHTHIISKISGSKSCIIALNNDGGRHEFVLGRDGDIVVGTDNRYVSRKHCTLLCTDSGILLTDTSLNGTVVDGKSLNSGEFAQLHHGSVLNLCNTIVEISAKGWD